MLRLSDEQPSFQSLLIENGHLIPCGIDGIYGQGEAFARIMYGLERALTLIGRSPSTLVIRFPPVIAREVLERCGYMHSFPHLAGSVYAFEGDTKEHETLIEHIEKGESYADCQTITDLALAVTACHGVYNHFCGARIGGDGIEADVENVCFRREPSIDPARLQSFSMREFVRIGRPDDVLAWRDGWIERGLTFFRALGLSMESEQAFDPFFGDIARFMINQQVTQSLKIELMAAIGSLEKLSPITSCNYHLEHFTKPFDIRMDDDQVAHSACIGIGMERIALALLRKHGMDVDAWPVDVRDRLYLN
jgi:seryl-tRNA synthetase